MHTVFVGCDPGASGYYCLLAPSINQVGFLPNSASYTAIKAWFERIEANYKIAVVMIEDVHSLGNMSAKSNFSFGRNVEKVHAIPSALQIGIELVQPKKWQKFVGIKSKKWPKGTSTAVRSKHMKEAVAEICERLYPKVTIRGPKGGLQDGKSDALMIAHYASQTYKV